MKLPRFGVREPAMLVAGSGLALAMAVAALALALAVGRAGHR